MKPARRYRIRFRDRPWKLLGFVILGIAMLVLSIVDPLDGEVFAGRPLHFTHVAWAHEPGRFVANAVWHFLGALFFTGLSVIAVYGEWNYDYLPPRKDPIDDPDFTQPL
jgi:hypothetical protein